MSKHYTGPTHFYGARAEKPPKKADFATKQTNICRLSGDITKLNKLTMQLLFIVLYLKLYKCYHILFVVIAAGKWVSGSWIKWVTIIGWVTWVTGHCQSHNLFIIRIVQEVHKKKSIKASKNKKNKNNNNNNDNKAVLSQR